jgi:hypothetical protein
MTWHAGSARVLVWEQLRMRALNALEAKLALPGLKPKAVDTALYQLKADGYANQLQDGRYQLTEERPPLPPDHEYVVAAKGAALDLVNDCPAGIDEALIAAELKMAQHGIHALLAEPIAQRLVQRQVLPGGLVRYLPSEARA